MMLKPNDQDGPLSHSERQTCRLSVVVPCYNEEAVIPELRRRLVAVCKDEARDDYEIILVNDGSDDGTWALIEALVAEDAHFVGVNLARNYGHQVALTVGLDLCRGERVLIIDADLQDPPELLSDMMRVMDGGANVVYGQRRSRDGETTFKKATAKAFYRLLSHLTDVRIPIDTGDFRLMDRKVVDVLKAMPEEHRFIRGMVAWVGFRQVALSYTRIRRFAGITKYPLRKMVRFAIDAITGFSIRPLRISIYIAMWFLVVAVLLSFYIIYSWLALDAVKGWTSTLLLFLVFGGVQLMALGIIGEYVGRTYMQGKRRPLYVIDEICSAPRQTEARSGIEKGAENVCEKAAI
jgi:dolichol-phosphate mannosyltransferase